MLDQADSLKIVCKTHTTPVDPFSLIFFLFDFENVVIEMLLKFFICVVDTKLFKAICLCTLYYESAY